MSQKIHKQFTLSEDKKILGVVGGIADYFELDTNIVRIIAIIIIALTGIVPGIIIYLIIFSIMRVEK